MDQDQPLSVNTCCTTPGGTVGQADSKLFFLVGGAAPYAWSLACGQFPPGLTLQTFADPRDANDELAGTPTTAGSYTFTMRLTDYNGQSATRQFTFTIDPPLQVTTSTLPAGTVGVPYSHDLDQNAHGGQPPCNWFVVNSISELPPGLTLDTTSPDLSSSTVEGEEAAVPVRFQPRVPPAPQGDLQDFRRAAGGSAEPQVQPVHRDRVEPRRPLLRGLGGDVHPGRRAGAAHPGPCCPHPQRSALGPGERGGFRADLDPHDLTVIPSAAGRESAGPSTRPAAQGIQSMRPYALPRLALKLPSSAGWLVPPESDVT